MHFAFPASTWKTKNKALIKKFPPDFFAFNSIGKKISNKKTGEWKTFPWTLKH